MKLLQVLFGCSFASHVLDLTHSFQENAHLHEHLMVEFYAPWCGHCKKLAPEYERAADRLNEQDPPIRIAKVDCTGNSDICKTYGVSGYPTIKMFEGGNEKGSYDGPRNTDAIVAEMMKKAGPSSTEVTTLEQLNKALNNKITTVYGYFSDYSSGNGALFLNVASTLKADFRFVNVNNPDLYFGTDDKIIIQRPIAMKNKFEDSEIIFTGEKMTVGILKTWIKENAPGRCPIAHKDNFQSFSQPLLVAFYKVDYELDPKGTQYWRNRVMKVAQDFKSVNFAISNNDNYAPIVGTERPGDEATPVVAIFDHSNQKFLMTDEFKPDGKALRSFIEEYDSGKLEAYIKSEPVPETQGANVKVVGKTFDEIVMNSDADVFLKIYAPWCGHCKSVAPIWEELAATLVDDPTVTIADFDATSNESGYEAYSVTGYPTILWAKKGNKANPDKYQGGRNLEDFKKWVEEHRSTPAAQKEEL